MHVHAHAFTPTGLVSAWLRSWLIMLAASPVLSAAVLYFSTNVSASTSVDNTLDKEKSNNKKFK